MFLPALLLLLAGAPPPYGAIPELHEALVTALDRGDTAAAETLFAEAPVLYVVDGEGQPLDLEGRHAVARFVSSWSAVGEVREPTGVTSCTIMSEAPSSCVVLLELRAVHDWSNDRAGFRW